MIPDIVYVYVGLLVIPLGGLLLVATVLLHFSVPRRFREEYLNERYFSAFELDLTFPASILWTLAFARAVAFPKTMVRRFGESDLRKLASPVFTRACQAYFALLGISTIPVAFLVVGCVQLIIEGRFEFWRS